MNELHKPFYVIPGNHDIGAYSHALVFERALHLKNIFLVDSYLQATYKDWSIYFTPFISPSSTKNKYIDTLDSLADLLKTKVDPTQKNIIVTHIQESDSKLGTEATMFAPAVEVIDLSLPTQYVQTLFLTGHMHMPQSYVKSSGIQVVYPGSLTYMDSTDCGQRKGYVLISDDGQFSYESLIGIRLFKRYVVPKGKDPIEFFSSIRMSPKEVVFVEFQDDTIVNDFDIRDFLKNKGCTLGKIIYPAMVEAERINVSTEVRDPVSLLEGYLQKKFENAVEKTIDWKNTILPIGKEFLADEIKHD